VTSAGRVDTALELSLSVTQRRHREVFRRLVIRTSASLARSLGSSVLAYRKVCQKGAGRAGV
jgi:hypothetical protein